MVPVSDVVLYLVRGGVEQVDAIIIATAAVVFRYRIIITVPQTYTAVTVVMALVAP
jgi:hypothetical protein